MRRRPRATVACLATIVGGVLAAASPPVKVTLKSAWPAPPLLLEIVETVSQENPDAFFPLLDRVSDPANHPTNQPFSNEAVHQHALQLAVSNGLLPEPGSLAVVEMNLGLHAATPKIEAFYQYYRTHAHDPNCGSWVEWYGEQVCDLEKLSHLAGLETIDSSSASDTFSASFSPPKLLPFDHVYPSPAHRLDRPPRTAILYASLDSPNFRELHTYLYALADKPSPSIEYVFRPIPGTSQSRNFLSGYGVALDLKKMDYLALDDRHAGAGQVSAQEANAEAEVVDVDPILTLIEAYPEPENIATDTVLTEQAISLLGFQATQLIADSSEPLSTLTQLAQNFPKYMTALSRRVVVNESLEAEIHANQLKAQAGVNVFWLNGMIVNEKEINPLGLLRLVRKEQVVMKSLTGLGLSRTDAIDLLSHSAVSATQADSVLDNVFESSDRPEGGDVIVWWNDFEKDSRYAQWSPSVHGLLRPLYPGQFHNIKLNLFNIVLVLDLSQSSSLNMVASVANIINRNFPFRFGVVPLAETEEGLKMARLFYHVVKTYGRKKTMLFLKKISETFSVPKQPLSWKAVEAAYNELLEDSVAVVEGEGETPESAAVDLETVIAPNPEGEVDLSIEKGRLYAERLGAGLGESAKGHGFVNGKHFDADDGFWRSMQTEIAHQLQFFQESIYAGKLTDETSDRVSTYFYDQPTTSLRRNRYIFPASGEVRVVNMPELFKRTGLRVTPSTFVYPPETEQIPLSMYVVTDFDSVDGLALLKEALLSINDESKTRVSFIHNPSKLDADPNVRQPVSWLISHLLGRNLLSKASSDRLRCALGLGDVPVVPEDAQIPIGNYCSALDLAGGIGVSGYSAEDYAAFVTSSRLVARELQFAPGQQGLIVNGRIVGPVPADALVAADFKTLESFELRRRAEPVIAALESIKPDFMQLDRASSANLISMATSVLGALQAPEPGGGGIFDPPKRPRHRNYQLLDGEYSSFQYGDNTTALYQIAVLVDPLSEYGQKWSSLLEWISHIPDIFIKVYTNPAPHEEIPLKRFYRYALLPSLAFDADGAEAATQAIFEGLPIDPIYTLAMDVPPSWLVRPREALYDLDNIQLGSLSHSSFDAEFALDYLVVDGHARDWLTNAPPRGVQLQLLSADSKPIDDTQVVANLGYLQFKAKPGVFHLEIREGRGRDIFEMESVGNEGLDSRTVAEVGNEIAVTSFAGLTIYPRLRRHPGMEHEDVLAAPAVETSAGAAGIIDDIASRMKSFFGKGKDATTTEVVPVSNGQADINIFTVASGLLYERFVSIMILSVLRNTNSTVKFWFIENFLSPSFLEFIPHLAAAYNFQYELVTYKWPSWLRAQKEKQRIIWAYKILFLDVLFPMDLKKVIFVDADQIVRADLKELIDVDLHGAPYGYTPMGDDNLDMEGFRFWKTGYWKDFLQGMPYHISALYVIDLVRFRQLAAGDILRGHYQALSADPGSLANLDQDLPNNIQREVPIFSLHEDWLWCETWCAFAEFGSSMTALTTFAGSKDRLHRAKTIDLCQNPLTKEPKLARARQIPEWEEYDSEISRFARKLAEDGVIRSQIVSADVNALAGAGPKEEKNPSSSSDDELPRDSPSTEHKRDEL
ncbi:UDP-glucose:glycoprotein glucosyltransferase-domain-containing protein [Mycena amicta]|nr:UDP-glucose:glycoprotein glucosyltransferase-domain-containing protein [Mycena amicta]